MKITYIKLVNVAGIYVGLNKEELEIDFSKSRNKIIAICGRNGNGKSVLISSFTPFASQTTVDERSTLSYILPHKDGYKEIHYQDGKDEYVIKHYFKATKDTHSVKSYFSKNNEELNQNGNVTSFNSLVEMYFGLTQEMMRLIRIGTNVNSFITLTPARRKEYIGKLIDEIDMYMKIYKKINEDIRVVKTMINSNNRQLYDCHISDPLAESEKLSSLNKDIKKYEKERDTVISKLSKIDSLIKDNNIDELRKKKQEAESSISEFEDIDKKIKEKHLEDASMDVLMNQRSSVSDKKVDIQSQINSYRITIDTALKNIDRLDVSIKKVTSDNNIQSLLSNISDLQSIIDDTPKIVKGYQTIGVSSNEIQEVLNHLRICNKTSQMIYALGDKPVELFVKLKKDKENVEQWLKNKRSSIAASLNPSDIDILLDQIFQDDIMISPICDQELFDKCPYYRFHNVIMEEKQKSSEENVDGETLNYINIINNNYSSILNELDRIQNVPMPGDIKEQFKESKILDKMGKKKLIFDLAELDSFLSLLKDWEIYVDNMKRLKQLQEQLSAYKKAGVDNQLSEIDNLKASITEYNAKISELKDQIKGVEKELSDIDDNISLVSKYNDSKKYRKIFEATIKSTDKILAPLENAVNEKKEYDFQLREISNAINTARSNYQELDNQLREYDRLVKQGKKLDKTFHDLSIIQEAVSTKKGIPVFYMKQYLTKIQALTNELLSIIYDDDFKLGMFNVTPDTFEVPYIKNGKKIPDIKYASQSEVALSTMALSFALANNAISKYNILLLDEIDAGLDETNRASFLKMLYMQMSKLHAEQVFIISHNLSQMTNVPMDCINMGENQTISKLQNVIFEAS